MNEAVKAAIQNRLDQVEVLLGNANEVVTSLTSVIAGYESELTVRTAERDALVSERDELLSALPIEPEVPEVPAEGGAE